MATQPIRIVGPGEGAVAVRLTDVGGGAIGQDSESYNLVTTGQETLPRTVANRNAALALTSGQLQMTYFTAARSFTSTRLTTYSGNTAAAATPTLVRMGLYTIAASGAGTQVAATANDTTLFAATDTAYTRNWTASVAITQGQRYALGFMVVTAVAAPTLSGAETFNGTGAGGVLNGVAPRLSGAVVGLTDLPATFTAASVLDLNGRAFALILPAA